MIRIRNTMSLSNKFINYNAKLNETQKKRLRQTPFKWVVDMTDKIMPNASLLEEMLSRWDPVSYGFRVSGKTVAFTPVDICFALGLQIVGESVPLKDDGGDCEVKSLFDGQNITVESIENKLDVLNTDEDVEDFCRVYILYALFALYFPRLSKNVGGVPFKLLDNLNMLQTYNWGEAVHRYLADSITRAAGEYAKGGGTNKEITLSGCSSVLQIWVLEHLPLNSVSTKCFPRINKWTTLNHKRRKIEKIFYDAKLVEDLVPTDEDKQFGVVVEATQLNGLKPRNDININFDQEAVLSQQQMLLAQNQDFRERIYRLQEDMKLLKKDDKGGEEESGSGKKEEDKGGNEGSGSGKNEDDMGGNEESGTGKKEEDKVGEEVIEYGKKEEDKKRCQQLVKHLFQVCTSISKKDVLFVKVHGQPMRGQLFECMKARTWVSTLLMSAATKIMMGDLLKNRGVMERFIFTHAFADQVIAELPHFCRNPPQIKMTKCSFSKMISTHLDLQVQDDPIKIMSHCNFIFAPTIYERHWFCYVLDKRKKKLYLLNSLFGERNEKEKELDQAMKRHFEMLLDFMDEPQELEFVNEEMPQQKNIHDCGIYVLKYLEMWDGESKWGDKTMPDFSLAEILHFREQIVCKWVLHPENIVLKRVREEANIPSDFTIDSLDS